MSARSSTPERAAPEPANRVPAVRGPLEGVQLPASFGALLARALKQPEMSPEGLRRAWLATALTMAEREGERVRSAVFSVERRDWRPMSLQRKRRRIDTFLQAMAGRSLGALAERFLPTFRDPLLLIEVIYQRAVVDRNQEQVRREVLAERAFRSSLCSYVSYSREYSGERREQLRHVLREDMRALTLLAAALARPPHPHPFWYTEGERTLLRTLVGSAALRHTNGSKRGLPDWGRIAKQFADLTGSTLSPQRLSTYYWRELRTPEEREQIARLVTQGRERQQQGRERRKAAAIAASQDLGIPLRAGHKVPSEGCVALSLRARNLTAGSDAERRALTALAEDPTFRRTEPRFAGKRNLKAIREELNRRFGNARTMSALTSMIDALSAARRAGEVRNFAADPGRSAE